MKPLVWLLFLPGFLCNPNPLTIRPDSLVTWKGSCVLIPCTIGQYKGVPLRDISLLWYFQPVFNAHQSDYSGTLLYNSSATAGNYRTRSQSASQPQATFIGNLKINNCGLKISQVRREDTGIYGARLFASYNHPVQRDKWFLNATVNVAESPPEPTMDISPKYIRESWMTVTCSVPYHCPQEPLRLTVNGLEQRRLSSQRTTTNNGVIQTVVGFQATWEDHGKTLLCSLNRLNRPISKSTMQLDVKYAPKDVQLTASPGRTIREGEVLSLECEIKSSNPEVSEYLWYKDDRLHYEWQNRKKIEFETEGDRHSGVYRCEAKNSVGTGSSNTVNIDVQYLPKEVKADRSPQGNIKEGESVVLQCSSKGNPPVTHYEWYKHPQTAILRTSERLPFDPIELGNAGAYYCIANNSLGGLKSSLVTLDVLYGPKDVQLAIENDQLPIKENDTVTLKCSFGHSNPSNNIWYKWYKASSVLSSQGNLLIFSANLEQAGDYRCEACNTVKCGSSPSVIVDIHYVPNVVQLTASPGMTIREGETLSLECTIKSSNPNVQSVQLTASPGMTIREGETLSLECKIKNSSPNVQSHLQDTSAPATSGPQPTAQGAHLRGTSAPAASGPQPTAQGAGPQSSLPPLTTSLPSAPLPSTSSPPSQSELPPSQVPISPLPSSEAPCDGRALSEELSSLNELEAQAEKAQNQILHGCKELKSAVTQLADQLWKELLRIRQRTCMVPSEIEKQ